MSTGAPQTRARFQSGGVLRAMSVRQGSEAGHLTLHVRSSSERHLMNSPSLHFFIFSGNTSSVYINRKTHSQQQLMKFFICFYGCRSTREGRQ